MTGEITCGNCEVVLSERVIDFRLENVAQTTDEYQSNARTEQKISLKMAYVGLSASTGCDSQPWFRIFNPWLQQAKFDSECTYIKRWIPELEETSCKVIHSWDIKYLEDIVDYPKPMINHKSESLYSKEIFKKISKTE